MPKFEEAYYLENDNWEVVSFKQLEDPNQRAILREKDLRNQVDGNLVLGIRNHPTTPHFYQKLSLRINIESSLSETDKHNEQRDMIKNFLTKYPKNSFGFYESPWEKDNKDKGFDFIIETKDYEWDKEVKFGLIHGKYIIFDILGRSKKLTFTDNYPFLAIEVVDTHFHSRETFKVLLKLSSDIPIKIFYYFISQVPYKNGVKTPQRSNSYSKNRIVYYISDGSFWNTNDRIEDTEECNIPCENQDEYYNYILDHLRENDFIR